MIQMMTAILLFLCSFLLICLRNVEWWEIFHGKVPIFFCLECKTNIKIILLLHPLVKISPSGRKNVLITHFHFIAISNFSNYGKNTRPMSEIAKFLKISLVQLSPYANRRSHKERVKHKVNKRNLQVHMVVLCNPFVKKLLILFCQYLWLT